jgi:hypothetical protein
MQKFTATQIEREPYQDCQIQGSLIKSRLVYIHIHHGAAALKKVLSTLPQTIKEKVTPPIYIGEWYPLIALVELDRAIAEVLESQNPKVYEDLGRFSANLNLNCTYEPLVHKDIHEFLQLTTVLHKSYQTFGQAQYIRLDERGALLQVLYNYPPPENFCQSGLGYFRRAIELCGGQQVSARITACQRQNDSFCEFRLEWRT